MVFKSILLFFYLFFISFLRNSVEAELLNNSYLLGDIIFPLFYVFTFFVGSYIVSFFSKQSLRKVCFFVLKWYWVILLPPLFDFYVFGRDYTYRAVRLEDFLSGFFTFFIFSDAFGKGLLMEFFIICAGAFFYVYMHTKSLSRSFFAFFSIYFFIALVCTPDLFFESKQGVTLFLDWMFNVYLGTLFLVAIGKFLGDNKKVVLTLLKTSDVERTLFFLFIYVVGLIIFGRFDYLVFMGGISVFFIWQFTVLLNNFYDKEIDKVTNRERYKLFTSVKDKDVKKVIFVFFFAALGTSFFSSVKNFFLCVLTLFLAYVYSAPPLRLRKTIFSTVFLGAGAVIVLLMAYPFLESSSVSLMMDNTSQLAAALFVAVTFGTTIKDLKDFEGDKKVGVRNIYTILGREKAKKLSSALLFASFLSPVFLFPTTLNFIVFFVISVLSMVDFYRSESFKRVIFYSFFVLFFCIFLFISNQLG